ncbi:MAG TPA: hypothetical protein VM658_04740 [bacterium]|nr:hypothetical protein [bacterium]
MKRAASLSNQRSGSGSSGGWRRRWLGTRSRRGRTFTVSSRARWPRGPVTGEARKGFKPECGWPEFLERTWLLEHHLDHLKRIREGSA